jgi:hypothetical protein
VRLRFDTPDSESIVSVEYDEVLDELYVQMRKGSILVYGQVPKSVYTNFEKAASSGSYFNRVIRWGGKYPFLGEIGGN